MENTVQFRLAPEHPIPACYNDSWAVMKWVASHANNGPGPEPWLNDHAKFDQVFLAGDSAGANIAHNMVVRASVDGLGVGFNLVGMVLIHPFFGNNEIDKLWMFICPETSGSDDPRLNPAAHPSLLSKLGCNKVLICTAGKDHLRERGWTYYEALRKSGWGGLVEIMETEGEEHVFHLFNPTSDKAGTLMNKFIFQVVAMRSSNSEIARVFFPFFRVYKDGRVQRFRPIQKVPPSDDPRTGVKSKDVVISQEPAVSARIFIPEISDPTHKLPLVVYFHGGGFTINSAFSPMYDNYLKSMVSEANIVAVSVEYRLALEHSIPACYDDSWAALQWVASHAHGRGPETWLNDHADFKRLFLAGDSAGGNICHNMAVRVGSTGLPGVKLVAMVLIHPFFGGTDDDKMWMYLFPESSGRNDPKLKPATGDLARLPCERVLVFVAENDFLRGVGRAYYEELKKSGWKGTVEIVESEKEGHVYHLMDPTCVNAADMMKLLVTFINQGDLHFLGHSSTRSRM
ncbi:hypothetical protein F0562_020661 [Nyssa sinensis]|uniref:Alpha/beta hydrolase fold-3 domain-containing protein n=1 Tax=Nyssa sinensis TaxID=561372 RepID=A0A5J5BSU4_9ASTE|nr:hypothetical protein F0562_020661 [Nyssa sinensis]